MNFLNIDSPIYSALSRIIDMILLNILWIVCSLPIITIGASTSALYYCLLKIARKSDSGIIGMFFHSFKDNLKQGCFLTIIFLISGAFILFDIQVCQNIDGIVAKIVSVILSILLIIWGILVAYSFPLMAQFRNTIKNILKNSVILSLAHFKYTMGILVLSFIPVILFLGLPYIFVLTLPIWFSGGIALLSFLNTKMFVKVFDQLIKEYG